MTTRASDNIGVAAIGSVLDVNTWSNLPYYFFKAGNEQGYFQEPWVLDLNKFRISRALWNARQAISFKGFGGYQFSQSFLNEAEKQIPKHFFQSRIISLNQIFPRASTVLKHGGRVFYYIDCTLYDLFREKDYGVKVSKSMQQEALAQELENYTMADAVIVMGRWVLDSLRNYYNIDDRKLYHILPGANIIVPGDYQQTPKTGQPGKLRPLVLGFIGKDWKRKGLGILLKVRDELESRGYSSIVRAIGECPKELQRTPGLEFSGFVNKQNATRRFIDIVTSCDIGCLFSKSEALGISTLEFLKFGVPVAGFDHQGLRDTLLNDASFKFPLNETVGTIADNFENFIQNESLQLQMSGKARAYSDYVTWPRAVTEFKSIIG